MEPRRIIWLKWKDPFVSALQEHKQKGWHDSYEYLERPGQVGLYQGPALFGPAGIIPLNELNSPSKNFNLWVGHTSFDLDDPTLDRMERVPGVEVLKVWTRYRFWLGVGKAFEEERVKRGVLLAAAGPPPPRPEGGLGRVCRHLAGKYPFWAVAEMPNGRLVPVGGDGREDVERAVRERAAGAKRVVTSWD